MAWQAVISEVLSEPGEAIVRVAYTDGTQKIFKEYRETSFDIDAFKSLVKAQLDQLESKDTVKVALPLGPFDSTITPSAKTPKQKFYDSLNVFLQMKRAINYGFMTEADQGFIALKQQLGADFVPEYLDLF